MIPWLNLTAENRAIIDAYAALLIEALEAYRPKRRRRAEFFDQAARHFQNAHSLVHRQTVDGEIAAALREIHLGNLCLFRAGCMPESILIQLRTDWRKALVQRRKAYVQR